MSDHGQCITCPAPAPADSDYCISCRVKRESEEDAWWLAKAIGIRILFVAALAATYALAFVMYLTI